MNRMFRIVPRCVAVAFILGLVGCAAIEDHFIWREVARCERYAIELILLRQPELRGTRFAVLETNRRGTERRIEDAPYFHAIVRYASDPDSRYRIFIVEQRVPLPGAARRISIRPGYARDDWHREGDGTSALQRVILSPNDAIGTTLAVGER